jgi:two-component system LytT family response regulator/two-component system response regulator LytT
LIVQAQSRLLLVDQAEICFASIDEGVIRIVTRNFEGQSKCRTLDELLELLDPVRFWRAHRGFVVNIDQIREVMPWFKSSYQLRMNDKLSVCGNYLNSSSGAKQQLGVMGPTGHRPLTK